MTSPTTRAQVEALMDYIVRHPKGVSIWQIDRHLKNMNRWASIRHVPNLVYLARNQFGSDVIVTAYDYRRGAYVYRMAQSLAEGSTYVERRVRLIRGIISNVIGLVDRLIAKYPTQAGVPMAEARARLIAAHTILDDSRP
jgi:hypothetical protein